MISKEISILEKQLSEKNEEINKIKFDFQELKQKYKKEKIENEEKENEVI